MYDEARDLIIDALDENENNGDLCYVLSQIGKNMGDKNLYLQALSEAVKHPESLTYPADKVEKEFSIAQNSI